MDVLKIKSPFDGETIEGLRSGYRVSISGVIYVARDAAHKRIAASMNAGEALPFDIDGQTIYYMGPTPPRPGRIIGSAGPTTSGRMDAWTPRLLTEGLKGMIGKGMRSQAVRDAIVKYKAVYLSATGGTGALISMSIKKSEVIAYEELGAEAVLRLQVEDFPAVVINDIYGGDLYKEGKVGYRLGR